jgi:hypothetical protein
MTDDNNERPWETEPDSLDFEADDLRCAMRRNDLGVWCGYVGVGPEHPLFGLPTNHPLKLPRSWFEGRRGLEGTGPMDLFIHAMSGKRLEDACDISLAFQVHGGITYADHLSDSDKLWWFGFDCGHAGDYVPGLDRHGLINDMIESMSIPNDARRIMRGIVRPLGVYRDQQYVVAECQSLAAQLVAIVGVIERENPNASSHDRRD